MTVLTDLRKMRKRLSDPAKWHKGDYFKDFPKMDTDDLYNGDGFPDCPACLYGTVVYVTENPNTSCSLSRALERVLPHSFNDDLVNFNDHPDTTHQDVLALIDRAIANEETAK